MYISFSLLSFYMDWRDTLEPVTQEYFQVLLKKVCVEKKAYTSAENITHAQMWTAMAILMKEISTLQLQVTHLEKRMKGKTNHSLKRELEKL